MSFFWIDSARGIKVTYEAFFDELTNEGYNNVFVFKDNPYEVFLNLLRNLVSKKNSIILDADFSEDELLSIELSNDIIADGTYCQQNLSSKFNSLNELFTFLNLESNNLKVEIYTSGTTGRPKKVIQTLKNITRAVKIGEQMKNKVWAFAYNPTHFAGLQVFFQAFFNKNTMVYVFAKDYTEVFKDFLNYKITNLSSTPTFMKMLIPNISDPLDTVESLTFGGERFNPKLVRKIKEKFPNSSVKNVYASSEAGSLLRAESEFFVIPDKYKKYIKIEESELWVHQELLGDLSSVELINSWYKTGDMVEYIDKSKFKFLNRKAQMINVGGYKVNPNEIEEIIAQIDDVEDVIVFGKKNSLLGNIIVASVVKAVEVSDLELKKQIKRAVRKKLQEYKVPQKINFVKSFCLTRTGKIKRA